MKLLLLVLILIGCITGGWWWLGRSEEADTPIVFENAPLTLEQPVAPESEVPRDEPVSTEPLVAREIAPALPAPSPAPAPVPAPTPTPAASVVDEPQLAVVDRLISFGYRSPSAARDINTIVLHSSYNASGGDEYDLDQIIGQYERYGVGAHYLIGRRGDIYRLVRESDIAYHAGESKMPDGRKNVNDFSIGIELVGTEESGFSDKQYAAVNALIADIETRHKIRDVVGHGDVAPTRKTDPWKFDWKKLK